MEAHADARWVLCWPLKAPLQCGSYPPPLGRAAPNIWRLRTMHRQRGSCLTAAASLFFFGVGPPYWTRYLEVHKTGHQAEPATPPIGPGISKGPSWATSASRSLSMVSRRARRGACQGDVRFFFDGRCLASAAEQRPKKTRREPAGGAPPEDQSSTPSPAPSTRAQEGGGGTAGSGEGDGWRAEVQAARFFRRRLDRPRGLAPAAVVAGPPPV